MLGRLLERLRFPGIVKPFEHVDEETGRVVKVRTTPRYTILQVDGKEYYFHRESGRFDGTGALSLDDPRPPLLVCWRSVFGNQLPLTRLPDGLAAPDHFYPRLVKIAF